MEVLKNHFHQEWLGVFQQTHAVGRATAKPPKGQLEYAAFKCT